MDTQPANGSGRTGGADLPRRIAHESVHEHSVQVRVQAADGRGPLQIGPVPIPEREVV